MDLLTELAGYPVFQALAGVAVACELVCVVGFVRRYPVTGAALLTALVCVGSVALGRVVAA